MLMREPVEGAVVLFNGKDVSNWRQRDGQPATWKLEDGVLHVGKGDILSDEKFTDAYIHLEWKEPDMPEATGQKKGNSGVFVQGEGTRFRCSTRTVSTSRARATAVQFTTNSRRS